MYAGCGRNARKAERLYNIFLQSHICYERVSILNTAKWLRETANVTR